MAFLLIYCMGLAGASKGQNEEVIISGEVQTKGENKGKVVLFLVDERHFKKAFSGLDTLIIEPRSHLVQFAFKPKKKGIYGIRCYQDTNDNGILDRGIFGPVEPYGFSWKSGKRFPFNFSDISFLAEGNKFVSIKLE